MPEILSPEEVQALLARLDELTQQAREIRERIRTAIDENQRLDEHRVDPEYRTRHRAHARDQAS